MMEPQATTETLPRMIEIGSGGLLAILIIDRVFAFMRSHKQQKSLGEGDVLLAEYRERMVVMANKVEEMHKWYMPDMREALKEQTATLGRLTSTLERLVMRLERDERRAQ